MDDLFENSGTFTRNAWEWLYETVDHRQFLYRDADLIYRSLINDFQPIHFGKYLRRCIFKKTGRTGDFNDLTLFDYQTIVLDSFRDNGTPASFTPTTSKLSAMVHNWLTQQSVKRQAVLLLGFGLKLSAEEVNELLYKALQEPMLNDLNPFEFLCRFCYQHGWGYQDFQRLRQIYGQLSPDRPDVRAASGLLPAGRLNAAPEDFARLIRELAKLKKNIGGQPDDRLFQAFHALYDRVIRLSPTTEYDELLIEMGEITTDSDIEKIVNAATPRNRQGNMIPVNQSTLGALFGGRRLSRSRIGSILDRKTEPDRFDLITLNFLVHSLQVDREPNPQKRYALFKDSTNQILADCFLGPLYVANPYECFLLMCMLSVSPLETYNDVIEKSYAAHQQEAGNRE